MAKVRAPEHLASFTGLLAGVKFEAGEGVTDNPGSLAYFRRKGFVIEEDKPRRRSRARTAGNS